MHKVVEKHDVKHSWLPLGLQLFLLQPFSRADLSLPFLFLGLWRAQVPGSDRGC